jgi:U3 small nucleolar ribonucleoprotein component
MYVQKTRLRQIIQDQQMGIVKFWYWFKSSAINTKENVKTSLLEADTVRLDFFTKATRVPAKKNARIIEKVETLILKVSVMKIKIILVTIKECPL